MLFTNSTPVNKYYVRHRTTIPNFTKEIILTTEASDLGQEAVLSQELQT